jgi:hypothetical protein
MQATMSDTAPAASAAHEAPAAVERRYHTAFGPADFQLVDDPINRQHRGTFQLTFKHMMQERQLPDGEWGPWVEWSAAEQTTDPAPWSDDALLAEAVRQARAACAVSLPGVQRGVTVQPQEEEDKAGERPT